MTQEEFLNKIAELGYEVRDIENNRKGVFHVATDRPVKAVWSPATVEDLRVFHGEEAALNVIDHFYGEVLLNHLVTVEGMSFEAAFVERNQRMGWGTSTSHVDTSTETI